MIFQYGYRVGIKLTNTFYFGYYIIFRNLQEYLFVQKSIYLKVSLIYFSKSVFKRVKKQGDKIRRYIYKKIIDKGMDDREEKKKFLISEIIDQGYDPEEFQEYLYEINGQQVDLDAWSFENLRQIVKKFQLSKQQVEENIEQNSKQEPLLIEKKQEQRVRDETMISIKDLKKKDSQESGYIEFNYQTKQENFSQIIDCKKIPPNQLLTKNVEIKITNFEKKQGGIFEQSYVTYTVETACLGVKVERRYSDFLWLKTTLELLHPGLPVPPIAKKGGYRRYDDKHLQKRLMILEMFLNKLVQIPELKGDQILENFLKFNDSVMFEKFKSDHKKSSPTPLNQVKNTRGKLNVAIDSKINYFLVKTQKHLMETQPLVKKIYKDYKAVATHLQECDFILKGIAKTCMELDIKEREFRKETELNYCNNTMNTIFLQSSDRLGTLFERMATTFRREVYSCVKYESLNMICLLDNFDKLKAYQHEYHEAKNSLFRKKERLYQEGNMAKWGLSKIPSEKPPKMQAIKKILPKETDELGKLRMKYGLRNFQTYQECSRHYSKNNSYLSKHLMKYVKIQSQITSQLMMLWVDEQTRVLSMEEGKSLQDVQIVAK